MNHPVLSVVGLTKKYQSIGHELTVLDGVSFQVIPGETLSVVGPSGSGKTTLLGLCAGLDTPTAGDVVLGGKRINELSEDDRARLRNEMTGFIFQNFQLLPTLTALENVLVPAELRGEKNIKTRAEELLKRVGLADRTDHYPSQLSGGEQQRVAVARAFMTRPSLLFADEPTGNLDDQTATQITELLFEMNREYGTTLILVTHNLELASKTGRILEMKGGKLMADRAN
ncbi:MAG: ABC transporter ATP-binding protein [Bacteroidetes bacterium]|nr:ABC transporter ATP-binding protein [Bacteroidota bacterium]